MALRVTMTTVLMTHHNARLLVDSPATGAWNMAVDQALLESAEHHERATLRFYRWSEPVLSLGYFQRAADRVQHAASLYCELVRRRSGGGAIVHDRELTYSLAIPSSHGWAKKNTELYEVVHQQIITVLAECGVKCQLFRELESKSSHLQDRSNAGDSNSFLCFQRRTSGDIVLGSHKIGGSAQRRLKKSLLQHGSVLLTCSAAAPELPGINDLSDSDVGWDVLVELLSERFQSTLGWRFAPGTMESEEQELARKLESERFLSEDWTYQR